MTEDTGQLLEDGVLSTRFDLYYDLFDPKSAHPAPLLIALHGYGANKRYMMREARAIAPDGFACASLQAPFQHMKDPKEPGAPARFGFGWLTNFKPEVSVAMHHRALISLLQVLIEHKVADGRNTFLLGFSQSCALNFRFAFTHTNLLRGVVGICGGIPGDWETGPYSSTPASVLYINGSKDEFYAPERVSDFGVKLNARADDVTLKSYDAGHELTDEMRSDVRAWLAAKALA